MSISTSFEDLASGDLVLLRLGAVTTISVLARGDGDLGEAAPLVGLAVPLVSTMQKL